MKYNEASPIKNQSNEFVDMSLSDLYDVANKHSAGLERKDFVAIINELIQRIKDM